MAGDKGSSTGGAGAKKKRKVKGLSQPDAPTDRNSPDNVRTSLLALSQSVSCPTAGLCEPLSCGFRINILASMLLEYCYSSKQGESSVCLILRQMIIWVLISKLWCLQTHWTSSCSLASSFHYYAP